MKISTVLFDLDDTLIVDEADAKEAFSSAARKAAKYGADPARFLQSAQKYSLTLWKEGPCYEYCRRIGVNDIECLWGNFHGDAGSIRFLQSWAQSFRVSVFDQALREQLIESREAAVELSNYFGEQRRKLQRLFPDALETMTRLKGRYRLGLLTNGAPDVQREKLEASGLNSFFDAVVVSGEYDCGKPEPEIFSHLLSALGSDASECVMVGNSIERDVAGAKAAGIVSIWMEVPGSEEPADVEPDFTIRSLSELPALLEEISAPLSSKNQKE